VVKRLAVIGLILSLFEGYASSSPAFATSSLAQQVAAIVQPQLDKGPDLSLGVAVGVVEPGPDGAITTHIFYFGQLIDQNNNPISLNGTTEFEIGSVTKTFTTTVLASLIQKTPALLNTPINNIFPGTPTFKGKKVTIRDLADYTSGLPDSDRAAGTATCTFGGGTIDNCYDLTLMFSHLSDPALSALHFAPGSAYLYSDLAVALLALAEPRLGGSTATNPLQLLTEWEAMVSSVVLKPLQMNSTHVFDPVSDPALLPVGYTTDSSGDVVQALDHNTSWPAFFGAGGLVSGSVLIWPSGGRRICDGPEQALSLQVGNQCIDLSDHSHGTGKRNHDATRGTRDTGGWIRRLWRIHPIDDKFKA
jgi:CubicO group peptidase (beta-lactamase class C family)